MIFLLVVGLCVVFLEILLIIIPSWTASLFLSVCRCCLFFVVNLFLRLRLRFCLILMFKRICFMFEIVHYRIRPYDENHKVQKLKSYYFVVENPNAFFFEKIREFFNQLYCYGWLLSKRERRVIDNIFIQKSPVLWSSFDEKIPFIGV